MCCVLGECLHSASCRHADDECSIKDNEQRDCQHSVSSPVSPFEFTDELSLKIGQWTICLVKNARQSFVNQSENGYG